MIRFHHLGISKFRPHSKKFKSGDICNDKNHKLLFSISYFMDSPIPSRKEGGNSIPFSKFKIFRKLKTNLTVIVTLHFKFQKNRMENEYFQNTLLLSGK